LCTDAAARTFWRHQDPEVADLPPAQEDGAPAAPIAELSKRDPDASGRTAARLAGLLPRLWRWLAAARPDLVLLHQDRSADAALLQSASDPRMRLDAGTAPDAGALVEAAAHAAARLDPALPLVVVAADGARASLPLRGRHAVVPAGAAMDAAATALATITVN